LASSYNNIGAVYEGIGEYSKALSFYEPALTIVQRSLLSNHHDIQDYRRAIEFVKRKL
jgi:tetratricopeptide (TPR) repeat protein